MFDQDTICAVSTPVGEGGIGIIRVSGSRAIAIAAGLFRSRQAVDIRSMKSHRILYGHIVDPGNGSVVDEVLLSVMRAPATYTREDIVEVNCHGGQAPLWQVVRLLNTGGARLAEPGEFTKRAFLNGRIDLTQAEAVMDIIRARTELSLRAANEQLRGGLSHEIDALREQLVSILAGVEAGIDFPEEDIEAPSGRSISDAVRGTLEEVERLLRSFTFGRILRAGAAAAIVGRPNVGKSSIMNALLRQHRAIVTDVPGTTRDVIEESLNIGGLLVRIIDTAGIRETHDMVEQEGVKRSLAAIEAADLVVVVLDGSAPLHDGDRRVLREVSGKRRIIAINKADLPNRIGHIEDSVRQIAISCVSGAGLDALKDSIAVMVTKDGTTAAEHGWAINERHHRELELARTALSCAMDTAGGGMSPELLAVDLRDALDHLGMIVGATYTDDILERIFNEFCIGK